MFTPLSILFNDPQGNEKPISTVINALITQKLPKLKKKKKKERNLFKSLLHSLPYLMTLEAINKRLALFKSYQNLKKNKKLF